MPNGLRAFTTFDAAERAGAEIRFGNPPLPCPCPMCSGATYDGPVSFAPPTSGVAGNGLPIFNWDQAAAQITRPGASWSTSLGTAAVVTYAYRESASSLPNGVSGFSPFSEAQMAMTDMILGLWSDVANIVFQRVGGTGLSNAATMLFGNYSSGADGASAFAYYPGGSANAGDVWINISLASNANFTFGTFGPHTMSHEIGHAIGLAHPADYDALSGQPTVYPDSSVYWQDSRAYTVMSYFGSGGVGHSLNAFAAGPQLHDIAAAQRLYGANMTTRTGDTIYGFNSNTNLDHYTITASALSPVFAIWDAGGIDTIDFSGYSTNTEIDLREEAFSSAGPGNGGVGVAIGNISIARGAVIENAIGGSGSDVITGNGVANVLVGGGGHDTITGGGGADTMHGEAGDDIIYWDTADGLINITGGDGVDLFIFTSGAAPTTFDLVAQGFESAQGRFADTGANPWATQTMFYDSAWRADYFVTVNDNASYSQLDYDQLNAFSWTTNFNEYDTAGLLDVNVTVFDTGVTSAYDFDQANAFSWVSNWNQYNAAAALDINVTVFDNGTQTSNDFDADSVFNWTSNWISLDALGQLDLNNTVFDNGVQSAYDFDQADAFTWSSNWNQYAAGGALDINVTVFDDGTSNSNDFDEANAFDWSSNFNSYNSTGEIDYNIVTFDNGNYAVLDYDQDEAFAWSTIWRLYNSGGTLLGEVITPDGG